MLTCIFPLLTRRLRASFLCNHAQVVNGRTRHWNMKLLAKHRFCVHVWGARCPQSCAMQLLSSHQSKTHDMSGVTHCRHGSSKGFTSKRVSLVRHGILTQAGEENEHAHKRRGTGSKPKLLNCSATIITLSSHYVSNTRRNVVEVHAQRSKIMKDESNHKQQTKLWARMFLCTRRKQIGVPFDDVCRHQNSCALQHGCAHENKGKAMQLQQDKCTLHVDVIRRSQCIYLVMSQFSTTKTAKEGIAVASFAIWLEMAETGDAATLHRVA